MTDLIETPTFIDRRVRLITALLCHQISAQADMK